MGGARDKVDGKVPRPGIAGADAIDGPEEVFDLSNIGADLSFVSAFLNLVPLVISPSNCP